MHENKQREIKLLIRTYKVRILIDCLKVIRLKECFARMFGHFIYIFFVVLFNNNSFFKFIYIFLLQYIDHLSTLHKSKHVPVAG